MKTFITIFTALFLIWRIEQLSNLIITINALTLILYGLLTAVTFYVMGYNALHLFLKQYYDRCVGFFNPKSKDAS